MNFRDGPFRISTCDECRIYGITYLYYEGRLCEDCMDETYEETQKRKNNKKENQKRDCKDSQEDG